MFLLLSRYRQAAALQYRFCLVCCLSDLPDFELPGIYTPNPQCGLQQQQTQHTMSYEKIRQLSGNSFETNCISGLSGGLAVALAIL